MTRALHELAAANRAAMTESELLDYINSTPRLLSLLYDIGLMPETHVNDREGLPWQRMLLVAHHFRTMDTELTEAKRELADFKITTDEAVEALSKGFIRAAAALAEEKNLSAAISRDCNATALERNDLRDQLSAATQRAEKAEREIALWERALALTAPAAKEE